uniref:MoaB/Mog domain-containing protein n=1 Tax=Oryzias latipes TaxID=8090 RepID=H2M1H4_ORYLA
MFIFSLPSLSRAGVRVRRLTAQLSRAAMSAERQSSTAAPTAAILIIGDEILKGYTVDTNSTFLTQALRRLGVSVQRITVIPDIQEVIAKEVALLSSQYTHLFTSGGIGPTHDDVTLESIAMAFQEEMYHHPDLTLLVKEFFGGTDKNSPAMKMAKVPRSAKLNYGVDPQTGKPQLYPVVC